MNITASIIKSEKLWKSHKCASRSFVTKIVLKVLNHLSNFQKCDEVEVVLLLTNNEEMKGLNQQFRSKDKPTNVLSFPDIELDYKTILEFIVPKDYINLGDLAFSYEVIKLEAEERGVNFDDHFSHLVVHGLLHLLGFDHENDEDASVMEALELDVLKELSIPSPY